MSGKGSRAAVDLPEDVSLSVENVSRTDTDIHEARYRPAVSIYARLRERQAADRSPAGVSYDVEGEDDDEDDEAESASEILTSPIADVAFTVRRGEAVGIVGSPYSAVRTLTRALSGMTAPSSGRIVMRGRIAPSVELAVALTSREPTVRAVARGLSELAGPGRRLRGEYVRKALELAFADEPYAASLAQPPKQYLRRAAVAATLDPFAEILLIDALPGFGDPAFPERCIRRIQARLAEGAAAVVACEDLDVIRALCSRVVWLEGERVRRIGPVDEVLAELGLGAKPEEAMEAEPVASSTEEDEEPAAEPVETPERTPRSKPPLRWFDEHAALTSVQVEHGSECGDAFGSGEEIRIRVVFDTATAATVRVVVRLLSDETRTLLNDFPLEPGSYIAQLRLPDGIEAAGDYDIAAWLIFEHETGRTKIGRVPAARIRVTHDESVLPLEPEGVARATDVSADDDGEWAIESAPPAALELLGR
ncbi:MAG: hypothetical protein ACR2GT_05715 [Gaiellaceae bacterium]